MKRQKTLTDESEKPTAEIFSELLTALSELEKEQFEESLEAFDVYVQRVRSKVHTDAALFHSRFAKGYQVLLDELKDEQTARPS